MRTLTWHSWILDVSNLITKYVGWIKNLIQDKSDIALVLQLTVFRFRLICLFYRSLPKRSVRVLSMFQWGCFFFLFSVVSRHALHRGWNIRVVFGTRASQLLVVSKFQTLYFTSSMLQIGVPTLPNLLRKTWTWKSLKTEEKLFRRNSGLKVKLRDCVPFINCWLVLFQPSTPTKVVFAEWVAGMRPPDPQTINKHVHDMVEVRDLLEYLVCYLSDLQ